MHDYIDCEVYREVLLRQKRRQSTGFQGLSSSRRSEDMA